MATMSQEQLRDAAQKALDALEEIALAGMSGTGQESEDGMRDWHARQAWKFIGIAARALDPIRQALATQPEQAEPCILCSGLGMISPSAKCICTYGSEQAKGGEDVAGELDPRRSYEFGQLITKYSESFNGQNWDSVCDSVDRKNLAVALDHLTEAGAMLMNISERLLRTHPAPAASAEREARVIEQNARKAAQEQLYAERDRHTAEVKRLQAEIGRLKAPAASDVIAMVRERHRGTKWGKAAECICDAVNEAILALRPSGAVTEGEKKGPLLVRDVAEIVDCTVHDVSRALVGMGKQPHSTNMALTPDEAVAVCKALRPAQDGDQWREAVEEQFAVNHTDMPEDPREAIKKLIATEVRDALDPSISSAAAALAQAGVAMTAARKDAVFQASIEFIGTLTGMTPPPIEVAPPEVFAPFRDFTNKVCAIFENAASPKEGGSV